MDTRGLNNSLASIMTELGYANSSKGVCKGFSCVWMMADFIGEEDKLLERLDRLCKTPIESLKQQFATTKEKTRNHQALNENDKRALDDMAFFDTVMMFQNSNRLDSENLFGKKLFNQNDIMLVAEQVMPSKLRDMGGMMLAHTETGMQTREELAQHLDTIASFLKNRPEQSATKYNILLDNYNHATVLQYNAELNQWRVINSNRMESAQVYRNSLDTADELFTGFPGIHYRNIMQHFNEAMKNIKPIIIPTNFNIEDIMRDLTKIPEEPPEIKPFDTNTEYLAYRLEVFIPGNEMARQVEFVKNITDWHMTSDIAPEVKDRITENGITLAYFAAYHDDDITLKKLLKGNADINIPLTKDPGVDISGHKEIKIGQTPIEAAIISHSLKSLQVFIDHGVDLNQVGTNGLALIELAKKHGFDDIITLLLKHGARPTLSIALGMQDTHHAKQLVENGTPYINLLSDLLMFRDLPSAARLLAAIPANQFALLKKDKIVNDLIEGTRKELVKAFLSLKANTSDYAELARDVVDRKNALGCIFHTPTNRFTHTLFSAKKIGDQRVTAEIKAVADSINSAPRYK